MVEAGELAPGSWRAGAVQGDALAPAVLRRLVRPGHRREVLEHIPDDERAMAELARVLRPGGTMAVTVPRYRPEAVNWALSDEYHNVPGGHIRIYRRAMLESRLAAAGLAVTGHHYAHGLHSPYWWLKCLVGTANDANPLVRAYHRLLVWDIVAAPRLTRCARARWPRRWWASPSSSTSPSARA